MIGPNEFFVDNNGCSVDGSASTNQLNPISKVTEPVVTKVFDNFVKPKNQPTLEQVWDKERKMAPIRRMEKLMNGVKIAKTDKNKLTGNIHRLTSFKPKTVKRKTDIFKLVEQNPDLEWDWHQLSKNSELTLDFVERHPDWNWNPLELCENPNFNFEFVERNINIFTKYLDVSMFNLLIVPRFTEHPKLNFDFVERHLDWDWNWHQLSRHPNLTLDFVERHLNRKWSWNTLSYHPNLTFEFVKRHVNKTWNKDYILKRFGKYCNSELTTLKEVDSNPDWNWDWKSISKHPDLTIDFINKYRDKLNWSIISSRAELFEEVEMEIENENGEISRL